MATLAEYLARTGETQAEFGQRAGVRQQVVSRWASAMAIPRPAFIATVARLTGGEVQAADFYAAHAARQAAQAAYARAIADGKDETAARATEERTYVRELRKQQAAAVPPPRDVAKAAA